MVIKFDPVPGIQVGIYTDYYQKVDFSSEITL